MDEAMLARLGLQPSEEVVFSESVTEEQGNRPGTLVLTNQRVVFVPKHAFGLHNGIGTSHELWQRSQPLDLPLPMVEVVRVQKPLFGNLHVLHIGDARHQGAYWVANGDSWVESVSRGRAGDFRGGAPSGTEPLVRDSPGGVGPLQAGMPPCPNCGTPYVRLPSGTMVCPKCGPPPGAP